MKQALLFLVACGLSAIGLRADPITLTFHGYLIYVTAPVDTYFQVNDTFDATATYDASASPFSQTSNQANYHLDSLQMTIHTASGDWTAMATSANRNVALYSVYLPVDGAALDELQFTSTQPTDAPLIDTHFAQSFKLLFRGVDALASTGFDLPTGISFDTWDVTKSGMSIYFDANYITPVSGVFTSVTSSADTAAVPEPETFAWWAGFLAILFVPLRRWGVTVDGLIDAVSRAMRISPFSPVRLTRVSGKAGPDRNGAV